MNLFPCLTWVTHSISSGYALHCNKYAVSLSCLLFLPGLNQQVSLTCIACYGFHSLVFITSLWDQFSINGLEVYQHPSYSIIPLNNYPANGSSLKLKAILKVSNLFRSPNSPGQTNIICLLPFWFHLFYFPSFSFNNTHTSSGFQNLHCFKCTPSWKPKNWLFSPQRYRSLLLQIIAQVSCWNFPLVFQAPFTHSSLSPYLDLIWHGAEWKIVYTFIYYFYSG